VLYVLGDPDLEMQLFGQLEHGLLHVMKWVGMTGTYLILSLFVTWIGYKHNMLEIVRCVEFI
jgi:hypothetical protein